MANRNDAIDKLKYGSFEEVVQAYESGAGIFFRSDVTELMLALQDAGYVIEVDDEQSS